MISIFKRTVKQRFSHRWLFLVTRWLDKRIPPASQHRLTMNNIFVLPTGFGWAFIIMSLCLFLLGTNYQNNLMVLLSYILLSVMLLTLFYTHQNFARLAVKSTPLVPFHCHQSGTFYLAIVQQDMSGGKDNLSQDTQNKPCRGNIVASWFGHKTQYPFILGATENGDAHNTTQRLPIPITHRTRGVYKLPRLTLACDFPLGLYKCWTHLDFSAEVVVYAKPLKGEVIKVTASNDDSEQNTNNAATSAQSSSDFHSLTDYKEGQPLNRVVWKQVAKNGDWVVKEFADPVQLKQLLSVDANVETETAISLLTFQVLEQSQQGNHFGLKYQSIDIEPSSGETHTHQCLTALACLRNISSPFENNANINRTGDNAQEANHDKKTSQAKKTSNTSKAARL
ncbi:MULTISPECIES: DUF58 domain-containing protein [unclassified Alteromonas]|uniref:DUF58 domain-containing protein n=1 Tax=unclassified Alteromonas TaxID=2614992 RepID=UPI000AE1AF4A|nr:MULTISPECIES: DUF58 domain-containing protein [unclassified Alteromonas]